MGTLTIKDLTFRSPHGHNEFERKTGNTFSVDVSFETDLKPAAKTDQLTHALDYSAACRAIATIMNGPSVKLIERLLSDIGEQLLFQFPQVSRIEVKLRKHTPPIAQQCAYIEISDVWQR